MVSSVSSGVIMTPEAPCCSRGSCSRPWNPNGVHVLKYASGFFPVGFFGNYIAGYIPQGHRFNIIEGIGCSPATHLTTMAISLIYAPPILVSMVSGIYAVLVLRAFARRRTEFNAVLAGTGYGNVTSSHYFRLMDFSFTDLLSPTFF